MASVEEDLPVTAAEKSKELPRSSPAHILVIVGEPFNEQHITSIVHRIATGLCSWDSEAGRCHSADVGKLLVDLLATKTPVSTSAGETVYELKSDAVCGSIILNPCYHTAICKLQSFLSVDSDYRFLLHAGLVFLETGNWILKDGPLSFSAFSGLFRDGLCNGTGPIDLAVSILGDWNPKNLGGLVSGSRVRIPPVSAKSVESLDDDMRKFAEQVSRLLELRTVVELLPTTEIIGNVTFSKPTMYIFSGGQGASSLFCISGYNVLVDGGFGRQSCFWSFVRHCEVIDSVLVTNLAEQNILGIAAFLERKVAGDIYPMIGPVFVNAPRTVRDVTHSAQASESGDELSVSLTEESAAVVERLHKLTVPLNQCFVPSHGNCLVNLYHKIGQGSLDMYVLSPLADSKEWKDFQDSKSVASAAASQVSVCAVIVFRPAASGAAPTRVLFCGSTSQAKIFSGCDRLKTLPLFETASGLPKEKPRPLSVSTHSQEKTLALPASKPRVPSVGSSSRFSRAAETKKSADIRVKEPTPSAASGTKTDSKELPKPTHHVDSSKKPVKKVPPGDTGVKPPASMKKDIRKPSTERQEKEVKPVRTGSRPSYDSKPSALTGAPKPATTKPSASKSEVATGMKSKKPDIGGRPKLAAKHDSEPQTTVSEAASEKPDSIGDKATRPEDENVEEIVSAVAESMADVVTDAGSCQEATEASSTALESADVEFPAPVLDAETITEHGPLVTVTAAEHAQRDEASSDVSVSKQEPERDVDEKDIDTMEAEHGLMAVEAAVDHPLVNVSVSENRHEEKAITGEEVLTSASDLPVIEVEAGSGIDVISAGDLGQVPSNGKDVTATHTISDQPDNLQSGHEDASHDLGLGLDTVESTSTKISVSEDEHLKPHDVIGGTPQSETSELKDTESVAGPVLAAVADQQRSSSEVVGFDAEGMPGVDDDHITGSLAETQREEVDDENQKPTGVDEDDVTRQDQEPTGVDEDDITRQDHEPTGVDEDDTTRQDQEPTGVDEDDITRQDHDDENQEPTAVDGDDITRQDQEPTGVDGDDITRQDQEPTGVDEDDTTRQDQEPTGVDEDDITRQDHAAEQDSSVVNIEKSAFGIAGGELEVPQENGEALKSEVAHDNAAEQGDVVGTSAVGGETEISQENGKPFGEEMSEVTQDSAAEQGSELAGSAAIEDDTEIPQDNGKPFEEEESKVAQDNAAEEGSMVGTTAVEDDRDMAQDGGKPFVEEKTHVAQDSAAEQGKVIDTNDVEDDTEIPVDSSKPFGEEKAEVAQDTAVVHDSDMAGTAAVEGDMVLPQDNGKPLGEENSEVAQDNAAEAGNMVGTTAAEDDRDMPEDGGKPFGEEKTEVAQGSASEQGKMIDTNDVEDDTEIPLDNGKLFGEEKAKVAQDTAVVHDNDMAGTAAVEGDVVLPEDNGKPLGEENSKVAQDSAAEAGNMVGTTTAEDDRDMPEDGGKPFGEEKTEVAQGSVSEQGKMIDTNDVEDDTEIPLDNGKPFGEEKTEVAQGSLVQDSCSVPEDNANGKPVGEGLPVDDLAEFDPLRDWDAPQPMPAPLNGKEQKCSDSTKPPGAAAARKSSGAVGTFKAPAAKAKRLTTHRDDFNVSEITGTSRSVESGARSRLSLQPGELKLLKTPTASSRPIVPFYVDLVSLPVSVDGTCTVDVDFFRRIRARYYVINSSSPDAKVLEFLATAKATWESPITPVTVIPTGNPDSLLIWCAAHGEQLTALMISVGPSASQCTVELQGSSCCAYRLEF